MVKIKKIDDLTLIYEKIPYIKSVSIGVWIKVGTAYENKFPQGISHFTEHMLFKGTKTRTAKDIAEQLDDVGGYLNAFSSKEYTCFYARIVNEHLEVAVDVLSDITINSTFDPDELAKEREVVIEEISMYQDNPDELANDLINEVYWKEHPFGMNILGTIESVKGISHIDMKDFVRSNYTRDNIIVSVVGNFEEENLEKLIDDYFKDLGNGKESPIVIPDKFEIGKPVFVKKDINQTHFCLALPGPSQIEKDKYPFGVMSSVLGGGMSSRLFQEIREKYGLVYTIYSYTQSHLNSGMFVVYFACNDKNTEKVCELTVNELAKIKRNNISKAELDRGKAQLKGNIVLALESSSARMRRQASSLIYYNKLISLDDVISTIDSVSLDDINQVCQEYLVDSNMTGVVVGPEKYDFNKIRGVL